MSCSALITGASRDIGLAIAQAYQAAGDRIATTYRSTPAPGLTVSAPSAEKVEAPAAQVPLGRLGRPKEIARAAPFFPSPEAAYITGQVLAVDGVASMEH